MEVPDSSVNILLNTQQKKDCEAAFIKGLKGGLFELIGNAENY